VENAWTAYNQAQLDTAQHKFGTASILFDGAMITSPLQIMPTLILGRMISRLIVG
jgi:hypothetical protein